MRIVNLSIVNFKNYSGFNKFNFDTTPDRNVILVGGLNGSGKTSLSEAIRLCLYGSKINGTPMSENKYHAFIEQMWCSDHKDQSMYIEMDVKTDDVSNVMDLTIRRSFQHKTDGKGISERLSLTRNGNEIELIDKNYWEYYIQHIIPAHISRYFFFDGEKTREIIASDNSADYLKTAIRDITEISRLDVLQNDLLEVKKRLLRNDIKPSVKKKITELEQRIGDIAQDIDSLQETQNQLLNERSTIQEQIEEKQQEYNRIVGIKNAEHIKAVSELQEYAERLDAITGKVVEFAYGPLNRIIMCNVIKKMLNAARLENDSSMQSTIQSLIEDKLDDIGKKLSEKNYSPESVNEILQIVLKSVKTSNHSSESIIDLTPSQIEEIQSQIQFDEEQYAFVKYLSEREGLSISKDRLIKEMTRYDSESEEQFDKIIKDLSSQLKKIDSEIDQNKGAIQIRLSDKESYQIELNRQERSLSLSVRDLESVRNIDRLIELIQIRSNIDSEKSITEFESSINEIYFELRNKDDMVKHISITDDYHLILRGYENNIIDTEWISEGEKGILMYSVVYALIRLSKSKLPVIIDSPLGRMDSIHVKNLITELYPKIGNQVIILSHDREITKEVEPLLEPIVSKKYLLTRGYPKIQEGYFE